MGKNYLNSTKTPAVGDIVSIGKPKQSWSQDMHKYTGKYVKIQKLFKFPSVILIRFENDKGFGFGVDDCYLKEKI